MIARYNKGPSRARSSQRIAHAALPDIQHHGLTAEYYAQQRDKTLLCIQKTKSKKATRELVDEIIRLCVAGQTVNEIASALGVSEAMVRKEQPIE